MDTLKIGLYIGSWPQNIGNAFFDLGAREILRQAFPQASLFPVGGACHWMFRASTEHHHHQKYFINKLCHKMGMNVHRHDYTRNSFEIGEIAELDILVFAGMSMCKEFVVNNGITFQKAAKRKVAVLGLGTGAAEYTEEEAEIFSNFLNGLGKAAVITRDDDTFFMFVDKLDNIASGIDSAFFLPDYYKPPKLDLPPYDIVNFDGDVQIPEIEHSVTHIINTHHDLWGILPPKYITEPNTLISDVPEDYLTLYSQVHELYSNRVHACIAALAYGNKAQLFSKTPRKSLFHKLGIQDISDKICSIDMDLLYKMKKQQVTQTRKFIEKILIRD
jgi:hypothetical protein